jgi:hypothetical protein
MPHYADGRVARVGDAVLGTTYNVPGRVIGVIAQITGDGETCNAKVAASLRIVEAEGRQLAVPAGDVDYTECGKLVPLDAVPIPGGR